MLTSTLLVAAESLSPVRSLASLIEDLHRSGLEVIYSSEIVPATLTETQPREGLPPLERARSALADHGLELRRIAPERYVVAIARAQPTAAELPAALPKCWKIAACTGMSFRSATSIRASDMRRE